MKNSIRPLLMIGMVAGLALSLNSKAGAQQYMVNVGSEVIDLTDTLDFNPETSLVTSPTNVSFGSQGQQITSQVSGFTDPAFTFAFGAVNPLTTPDNFGLIFNVPVTGLTGTNPVLVTITISGSISDVDGSVTVTPDPYAFAYYALLNGVKTGPGIGTAQTYPSAGSNPYGGSNGFSTSFIANEPITSVGANVSVLLTGQLDAVSWTGTITVVEVPEPGVFAMMVGFGTCGSLLAARRLRKRA